MEDLEYYKRRVSELKKECAKKQNEINEEERKYKKMTARCEIMSEELKCIFNVATRRARELLGKEYYEKIRVISIEDEETKEDSQENYKSPKIKDLMDSMEKLKTILDKPHIQGQPIEVAERIITTTVTREKTEAEKSLRKEFGNESDTVAEPMYSVPEIRQIAEHLLVYCNANEGVE